MRGWIRLGELKKQKLKTKAKMQSRIDAIKIISQARNFTLVKQLKKEKSVLGKDFSSPPTVGQAGHPRSGLRHP